MDTAIRLRHLVPLLSVFLLGVLRMEAQAQTTDPLLGSMIQAAKTMKTDTIAKTVIEPYSLWAGVPAKFIKKVSPEQSKELNERIANNYQMYASWFDKEENPQP